MIMTKMRNEEMCQQVFFPSKIEGPLVRDVMSESEAQKRFPLLARDAEGFDLLWMTVEAAQKWEGIIGGLR